LCQTALLIAVKAISVLMYLAAIPQSFIKNQKRKTYHSLLQRCLHAISFHVKVELLTMIHRRKKILPMKTSDDGAYSFTLMKLTGTTTELKEFFTSHLNDLL
jgi:hypothetical protein